MKLFGGASALLALLSVGVWAQIVPPPTDTNPAVKSGVVTTPTPLPIRDQTDAARPMTLQEAIDAALQQASNFKAARFNEQIAGQAIKQAKAALHPRVAANPAVIYTSPSAAPRRADFAGNVRSRILRSPHRTSNRAFNH